MSAPVRVHVASIDTAPATELCIRSARRFAGCPFELVVGDGGSTDGSVEMLRKLERRGWLHLELAPAGRGHAEWLEHWLRRCDRRFAVFVDSDVEFLASDWLTEIVAAATRTGAALVCAELLRGGVRYVHPLDGTVMQLAARPSPWLFLVDVPRVTELDAGFGWASEDDPEAHGGMVAYDVGASFFRALVERGLPWAEMPAEYRRKYHHYGGLSWKPLRGRPGVRQALKLTRIRWRLARMRRQESGSRAP